MSQDVKNTGKGTVMITTGGTGGHIFPGVAVARRLQAYGWNVFWLGTRDGMEAALVPQEGINFEGVSFRGVRGKGLKTLLLGPWALLMACHQSRGVLRRRQPDVVIGFGGFASFPGAFTAVASDLPLVVHEANAVPGLANRVLRYGADKILVGFPGVFGAGRKANVEWSGNPVRDDMVQQASPSERFADRQGPLRVLVVGGSLGAQALNACVPTALAQLPVEQRPRVIHQAGARHIEALRTSYAQQNVEAECVPFIEEMGQAYADADFVICRGGAMTVAELAAVGVGALMVPLPGAIADEQRANAQLLVDAGAAVRKAQESLTPDVLAEMLRALTREKALAMAEAAFTLRKTDAAETAARACMALGLAYRSKHRRDEGKGEGEGAQGEVS
ncbi:MAG: undecaprenyldiphospho-muramoylpentapeptide beta-N-acetylglucosaminyltransferase [Burkholderiales bacterium]|jgi:UDP-N-acetylglucosamine--N-acetylmuramyl-(pentapeptide) pyrophosphoryl-undecaprenol N-acetylglucosamine transferase|nr:undecaprenyldiphospho-muramoylpentapeptide beta-N-acetylglucosaminyltransferase [Burkholderiales bacterium]